jgi:hypothetical protein
LRESLSSENRVFLTLSANTSAHNGVEKFLIDLPEISQQRRRLIDSNILAAAIGLLGAIIGALVTACFAFRSAKISRDHDDKRDRRRVWLETVSAILELFEQIQSDVLAEFALVMQKSRIAELPAKEREQAERDLLPFTGKSIARYSRIGASFGVIRAKVIMLKLPKALEALTEYAKCFEQASREASQRGIRNERVEQTALELRSLAKAFEAALIDACTI